MKIFFYIKYVIRCVKKGVERDRVFLFFFITIKNTCNPQLQPLQLVYYNKKNECVKTGSPGASAFNKVLQELKNQVLTKLCECKTLNIPYTAKDLLSDKNNLQNANSLIFKDLMNRKILED